LLPSWKLSVLNVIKLCRRGEKWPKHCMHKWIKEKKLCREKYVHKELKKICQVS
jgi:hypothetical protein